MLSHRNMWTFGYNGFCVAYLASQELQRADVWFVAIVGWNLSEFLFDIVEYPLYFTLLEEI